MTDELMFQDRDDELKHLIVSADERAERLAFITTYPDSEGDSIVRPEVVLKLDDAAQLTTALVDFLEATGYSIDVIDRWRAFQEQLDRILRDER